MQHIHEIEFKKFSPEEHEVWRLLCEKQLRNLEGKVSHLWQEGWDKLGLSTEKIPDFVEVNKKLKELTGWQIVMTDIEYEDSIQWMTSLREKKHRVTNFIRNKKSLDYTPLPDIFHDVFGHVPFLAHPQYARIIEKFGRAACEVKGNDAKEKLVSLGWYGYEFGLIREKGELRALGTGLVSSEGELQNAFAHTTHKDPYALESVCSTKISPHEFHKKLFVLRDLDQLEKIVDEWLQSSN
jgi:phenylalanine-4-hydroxylase